MVGLPVLALGITTVLLSGAAARGVESGARSGAVLIRCDPGSADQQEARRAWEGLRERIAALGPDSDPEPALASLRALLDLRCFELAAEHGAPPIPRHPRVLVENLREAAWMIFLEGQVESVHVRSASYPIPRGAPVRFDPALDPDDGVMVGGGIGWSTAMTSLSWRWLRGGSTQLSGRLTWPEGYDPAEAHAARLLHIAERSFLEGCPPALPPGVLRAAAPGISDLDADHAAFGNTLERLAADLGAADLESACREVSR